METNHREEGRTMTSQTQRINYEDLAVPFKDVESYCRSLEDL
jgi:hypothetical protein